MSTHVYSRAAYYVTMELFGLQYATLNCETGAINFTSNPHEATMFTSMSTAMIFAGDIEKIFKDPKVTMRKSRHRDERIIVGTEMRWHV